MSTSQVRKILERLGVPKPNKYAIALIARPEHPSDLSAGWHLKKSEEDITDVFKQLNIAWHIQRYWNALCSGAVETARNILRFLIQDPLVKALG